MLFTPGRCLQCLAAFKGQGGLSPQYSELMLKLDNEITIALGLCVGCDLKPEEYDLAIEKLNEYYKLNGGPKIEAKITEVLGRRTYKDIIYATQSGGCLGCHKPIEGNWVITSGVMLHEGCNLPPPAPIEVRSQVPLVVKK